MEIKGTVIQVMAPQTGTGKKGAWTKQDFILETPGQYPKRVCITIWGDKGSVSAGEKVTVSVDLESREYNGRWYTEVRAWKVLKTGAEAVPTRTPAPVVEDAGPADDGFPW